MIDPSKVEFGPQVVTVGSDTKYIKQKITYNGGQKLMFYSYTFPSKGVRHGKYSGDDAIIVPINPELRKELDTIEDCVREKVKIPEELLKTWTPNGPDDKPYKPIWPGEAIYMRISQWCMYFNSNSIRDGEYMPLSKDTKLESGLYTVVFEIPFVYIGTRTNSNKLVSICLRATQILHKPSVKRLCLIKPPIVEPINLDLNLEANAETSIENTIKDILSESDKFTKPKKPTLKRTRRLKEGEKDLSAFKKKKSDVTSDVTSTSTSD